MQLEEALALKNNTAPITAELQVKMQEAINVLADSHVENRKTIDHMGSKLLSEMSIAADWQAVATRSVQLLKMRNKPGVGQAIEEFIKRLEADPSASGRGEVTLK